MDFDDLLKLALSIFLIVSGLAVAYLFFRMAGVFERLGSALRSIADEMVPILTKAQTTMDGVNREIDRVDEIMVTAVNTTKGAEAAVTTVTSALTTPVRKLGGAMEGVREALRTYRARRAADAADDAAAAASRAREAAERAAGQAAEAEAAADGRRQPAAAPSAIRHASPY